MELLRVVDVDYLHDYTMELEFLASQVNKFERSNGECRIVDFKPLLTGKLCEQLLDHDKFVQFALTDWTLEWYNGVDFASERLYELGVVA